MLLRPLLRPEIPWNAPEILWRSPGSLKSPEFPLKPSFFLAYKRSQTAITVKFTFFLAHFLSALCSIPFARYMCGNFQNSTPDDRLRPAIHFPLSAFLQKLLMDFLKEFLEMFSSILGQLLIDSRRDP